MRHEYRDIRYKKGKWCDPIKYEYCCEQEHGQKHLHCFAFVKAINYLLCGTCTLMFKQNIGKIGVWNDTDQATKYC